MISFNNPAGFWALLGIPIILAIHFLQRKSVILPISTLFLLDQLQRESVSGKRIERLRSSIPLWLQILMALLLTWLLIQPRWLEKSRVQRVVVVLDASASMLAFKEKLKLELPEELGRLSNLATTSEYVAMSSLLEEEHIYRGTSLADMEKALKGWMPSGSSHDITPALRLARSVAEQDGLVILVTDHAVENPAFAAKVFSVGIPLENAGFAGLTLDEKDGQLLWKATLKNYGNSPQKRAWWTEINGIKSTAQTVTLAPGQGEALQGLFPPAARAMTIHSDSDAFTLDDSMRILRPEPKRLSVLLPETGRVSPAETKLYQQLFNSLTDVTLTTDAALSNVLVAIYDPLNPVLPSKPAIVFPRDPRQELPILSGEILPEAHPLMNGLNWQSLLCLDSTRIPLKPSDQSLLWQGERSLIFLRGEGIARQLCFNFDLRHANAHKLPAFVVLIHRFFESVREQLPLREIRNSECGEKLALACSTEVNAAPLILTWKENGAEKSQTLQARQVALLKAPPIPGEFHLKQGAVELLHGASHFADTREADFKDAGPRNDLIGTQAVLTKKFSREDSHWRLFVLALLSVALACWWLVNRSSRQPVAQEA